MTQSLSLTIPSRLEKLDDVQTFAEELKERAGLDDEKAAGVSLALNEAVTNAVRHGNKGDADKKVEITANLTQTELLIEVEDEGEGFNPELIPDPLAEENVLKTSGRGVYLMKQFSHVVRYSAKGNKVTLVFKR
ncbi:MAG: ATP-binding protein [Balneolales bacterium]